MYALRRPVVNVRVKVAGIAMSAQVIKSCLGSLLSLDRMLPFMEIVIIVTILTQRGG